MRCGRWWPFCARYRICEAEDVPAARPRRDQPDQRRRTAARPAGSRSRCPGRSPQAADAATVWTAAAGVWAPFPASRASAPPTSLPPCRPLRAGNAIAGSWQPIAAGLSLEEMRELALLLRQPAGASAVAPHQDTTLAIERGKAIASRGIPSQRVPSCVDCHGPGATPPEPDLSRTRRPVRRLSRPAARALQKGAPRRYGLCPPHAPGGRPADPGADARRGAVLCIAACHPRSPGAVDGFHGLWGR